MINLSTPGVDWRDDAPWHSRRLWSLWDMLKIPVRDLFDLGMSAQDIRAIFIKLESEARAPRAGLSGGTSPLRAEPLDEQTKTEFRHTLKALGIFSQALRLTTSTKLLGLVVDDPPETERELDLLLQAVRAEMEGITLLFVPPHVAPYYEWDGILSDDAIKAFPKAFEEIRNSGTALAAGLHTASVFHAMRAAEIGVRALGHTLEIEGKLSKPLEESDWQEILNAITSRMRDIENEPRKTPDRDARLQFFSEAAAQFRFFKNAWRVRVAHARATYDEPQAKEVIDHVRSFFETLCYRLTE